MASWSQSHFLQSLGWATLNSFWQMALLWCIYLVINSVFKTSSHKKYQLAVVAILTGFAWFAFTFVYYFNSSSVSSIAIFNQTISESNSILNIFLLSASLAYLSLLIFPSYRLFKNWQFVQRLKKEGLKKADLHYRLFVKKIAAQFGIKVKVMVYLSELVRSPLTVGYLKPIILLPIAALNNLSTQQVEAILLHEVSHIRRYDYLVNFVISIINTLLYFNPFVKQFMRTIEEERENCCDQLVLQFGYDKVGYASALLSLERLSLKQQILALGATGKTHLLSRIEKIVGMEKKKRFQLNHIAGILAALFCIIAFNSVLIIKEQKKGDYSLAYDNLATPFNFFDAGDGSKSHSITPVPKNQKTWIASTQPKSNSSSDEATTKITEQTVDVEPVQNMFMHVGLDDVEASLTKEQKEEVKSTVAATKKVLSSLQWQEVENTIADAMNEKEKVKAKQEYLTELEKTVNWKNIEQNMKAHYERIDWPTVNSKINFALKNIQLDSLEKNYTAILLQLDKASVENCVKAKVSMNPLPDQSLVEICKSKEELRRTVDTIKALRNPKKVVRL